MPTNKKEYMLQYQKEKLKRVPLDLRLDYYTNVFLPAVEKAGLSVSGYIKAAIAEKIERDNR